MAEQRHVKLFRNGRGSAVRIPVEFELPGDEAIMHRDGDGLVIEPVRERGLVTLLKTMRPLGRTLAEHRERRVAHALRLLRLRCVFIHGAERA
jgi:antitoxin VapB